MSGDPAQQYLDYVAAHVRRGREKLKLTQEQFAEQAGFDARFFRFVEQATKDLSVTTLVRLAAALGCEPSALLRPTRPVVRKPGRPKKKPQSSSTPTRRPRR
jgi:transcriptional regulator with XRE-family HTH domain